MADYTSIDDIVAGVENATQTRNNSKNDDGTDTLEGVDWFSYKGTICSKIYASGNSWIGLGASSEHLKVNKRDAAMWNVWREEGTYSTSLHTYNFLRIRWSGYTSYSSTSSSALLTFDVLIFETGDIMLYVADIPTSNYTGIFSLNDVTYDKPTVENRYVTFYLQSDGSYVVEYAPIDLAIKKYLVRDVNTLYTITDGSLVEVSGELNSNLFIDNGVDEIPSGTLLMTLSNPEVLCWADSDKVPTLTATVKGIPEPQIVMSKEIDLMHSSIKGINGVIVDCKGDVLFAVSFDKKATWMMHNGTEFVEVYDKLAGMTKTEFEAITTEQWQPKYEASSEMYIRCAILDKTQSITTINIDFIN